MEVKGRGKSYWTKRRKVDKQLQEHMANIARFDRAMTDQNMNSVHESSESSDETNHSQDTDINVPSCEYEGYIHEASIHNNSQDSDANRPIENEGSTHEVPCQNRTDQHEISEDEYENRSENGSSHPSVSSSDESDGDDILGNPLFESDDSDIDETCNYENGNGISIQLSNWAVANRITHTALKELLKILTPMHPSLPADPRTLLSTRKVDGIVAISGGWYYHFGIAEGILAKLSSSHVKLADDENQKITLQVNIDGLPLFKSSNAQFWPILCLIHNSSTRSEPFIVGLFSGNKKPGNSDEFLRDFVNEMKDLQLNGMHYNGLVYKVIVSAFVCDAPARAFIKKIKPHNAYHSCEKCTTRGEYEVNKVILPSVDAPLRTNESFKDMADEDHHTGCSLLVTELNFNMITGFPLDPMHLIYLGITRRLLNLWVRGPLRFRLGPLERRQLSDSLLSCRGSIPKEFARKPRSIAEMDRWKATELRSFVMYLGPVVLKGRISEEMFSNFMLLSTAVNILSNPALCHILCDYARDLLVCFIRSVAELYGRDQMIYNIHCAQHLADDVKLHGPLDQFAAFPFESYMLKIKNMVRKPNFQLQQVVLRLSEISKLSLVDNESISKSSVPVLKMEHSDGPLPRHFRPCTQYRDAVFADCVISSQKGDNCVKLETSADVVVIRNIVQYGTGIYVIYNRFLSSEAYFSYPLDSRRIDIFRVSRLSTDNLIADIFAVKKKMILLPYRNNHHVAFPLTHTF